MLCDAPDGAAQPGLSWVSERTTGQANSAVVAFLPPSAMHKKAQCESDVEVIASIDPVKPGCVSVVCAAFGKDDAKPGAS